MQKNNKNILSKIVLYKKQEVINTKSNISLAAIKTMAVAIDSYSTFYQQLKDKINNKQNAVIAEIKKSSPSKGILRHDFDPVAIAKDYKEAGATCLSILTDKKFFQGDNNYIQKVAATVDLPILRKEFIIDKYQIYEAKVIGASSILLIVAILNIKEIQDFYYLATDLGMDVLVEVHNKEELLKIAELPLKMIGINNRNLHDFTISLNTTLELLPLISDKLIITESGILDKNDVTTMNNNSVYGFLVGEVFMRSNNICSSYQSLFND